MKTICYLADASNPHTIKWCNYFKNRGYNIHVISLNEGNIEGVTIHNFTFNVKELKNKSPFRKIKYITCISEIKKIINKIKPDILHAHYASSYGLIGSLVNYHPYIISVWGTDVYDFPKGGFIQEKIIRYNLKKADYIFSTSKDMARETKLYTDKHIYITPFGVDMEEFKPIEINDDDKFIIGTIKTLEKKYGIDYLIKGFKLTKDLLPNEDLILKIGGNGSQHANLVKLAKELNIEHCVEFLGRIPLKDVPSVFNSFDVAVFPSLRESFGVAAVEAQACKVPVIVSNVGGHPEVVDNEKTGIVIDSESEEEVKDALIRLIKDENLRQNMKENSRKFVKNNYELNSNFIEIEKIYSDILSSKK